MDDRDAQASVSGPSFDPRAQREAVSVAERMLRAFLKGRRELVEEMAGKVEELDGLGNYSAAVAVAREWLAAAEPGLPAPELLGGMAAALAGDPLASLLGD